MPETLERDLREGRHQDVPADWRSRARKASLHDRFGKRFKPTVVGIGLVLVLAVVGLYFFAQSMSYESTDDAFIDGHITNVAPKIAARIDKGFINDNPLVKKGDPIVEIDPRDYDAQLRQKQAALESTKAQAVAAQAGVDQQIAKGKSLQATLDQDKADQRSSEAQADQTADNLRRQQDLYDHHVVSIQDLTNARDSNRSAEANVDSAKMKVLSAEAEIAAGPAGGPPLSAPPPYLLSPGLEKEAERATAPPNTP